MPTETPNGKNGIRLWFKRWYPIVIAIATVLSGMITMAYGFGKKAQGIDSVLKRHDEVLQKQDIILAKLVEITVALDKNQTVQTEFYKLFAPRIWQQAIQRMDSLNGHDSLRPPP
jgi:hypothetical protein